MARSDEPRLARLNQAQEANVLAALGDARSRAILLALNDGPRTAQEVMLSCDLPQASVYRKLGELQEAGLVGVQRSMLTPDGHRIDLFRSTVVAVSLTLRRDRLEVSAAFRDLASERLGEMWKAVRAGKKP